MWLNSYSRSPASDDRGTRRTNSLVSRRARHASTRARSFPPIAARPASQPTLPSTAASCSTAFSSAGRASRRAAMIACTVSGRGSSCRDRGRSRVALSAVRCPSIGREPLRLSSSPGAATPSGLRSRSMRTYSSANNGLPPTRASRPAPTVAGTPWRARSVSSRQVVSASESGPSSTVSAPVPRAQPERRSSSLGRAVATTSSLAWPVPAGPAWPARLSTKSSSSSSAQCRSSRTSTSGRRLASPKRKRRHAARRSWRSALAGSSLPVPTSGRRWRVTQVTASASSARAWRTAWVSLRSTRSAGSLSRMPASVLTISASAQNAIASPYGRERPTRQATSSSSASTARPSSATRRLLPIPGGPTRVTSWGVRALRARSNAACSVTSSCSRPTSGPLGRLGDEHGADRRGLLQPRAGGDEVAGDPAGAGPLQRAVAGARVDQRLAGGHGDAELHVLPRGAVAAECLADGEGGAHRPLGVVLTGAGHAADGHGGAADGVLDRAAEALHLAADPLQVAGEHVGDVLGVPLVVVELGRVQLVDVAEQHGDELALGAGGQGGAAGCLGGARRRCRLLDRGLAGGRRRGEQVERGVLREDCLLQALQPDARLDAELVDQGLPGGAVGGQRLGLPAAAVQGEHELAVQVLAQRVLAHQRLQLTDQHPLREHLHGQLMLALYRCG